jgi:uncharacterized membrane protein YdjX (TVP38/TMEM64 family)
MNVSLLQRNRKLLTTAAVVAMIAVSVWAVMLVAQHMAEIEGTVRSYGVAGPVLIIVLYGLLGASPIPAEPLTLINGAVFGPVLGTLIAGTGNTLAAVIEYYIGAGLGSAAEFQKRRARLPFGLGRFPVHSPLFLIGARMIPGYGPKLVSVMAGMYRVPMWRYLWTSAVPSFLGAAIFAYGGFGLLKLF